MNRRDMLKAHAAAVAALAAGVVLPATAQPVPGGIESLKIKWSKAPCRFCGTGCGVMVGVKDGRVVATHGDMQAEVNRGLNCVKGYFLSKIMYGADRLTSRCCASANGALRQGRRVHAGLVGRGLRRDGGAGQARAEGQGSDRGRHVRLRPVDDLGRLRRHQADACRFPLQQSRSQRAALHGVRRVRLHAHLRHGRADGLLRRFRAGRCLRALGLEHGGDASDPVDPHHRPAARPPACQGRGALHLHQPQLRSRRPADRLQAGHRPRDPQLHRQPHHPAPAGSTRTSCSDHTTFMQAADRYRLWPAARGPAREEGEGRRRSRRDDADDFDAYAQFVKDYTLEKVATLTGVEPAVAAGAGRALRRSRSARSCRCGRWGSTSMSAASGRTSSSTICIC